MRLFANKNPSDIPRRPSQSRLRFNFLPPWQQLLPWVSIAALLALIIIPLCLLVWLAFFTDIFVVQAVTVTDARPHTTQATRQIIEQYLADNPLSKNIFFTQSDSLEQRIESALPQVRTVHIARKLPGTIKAIIQEKTATLLLLSNATYYFVDQEGIAYEEARLETLPGTLLPTVKNNDQGSSVTVGIPVVSKSFVQFVQFIEQALPNVVAQEGASSPDVAEIRIPSLSAREVHFLLTNNWIVRFDVTRPPQGQLETLEKLLRGTIPIEEQQQLEYIDLRIPDRVYYKTRDSVRPSPTPSARTESP